MIRRLLCCVAPIALAVLMTVPVHAQLSPYAQDFEFLDQADPGALTTDGWLVFGNVFDGVSGGYLYGYGVFGAPNGGAAFSAIDFGQGGLPQGDQQLVIYNNYNIRMTGGQIPLETDFDKEGPALGFEVLHVNPYRVNDNAELFKELYSRYLNKEKIMVVADGVCVLDMGKDVRGAGIRMGHFKRSKECQDLKFAQERERVAREEPEKLKDLPRFKCRLCGIGLRCHALLNNDPSQCFGCGSCIQFPCPKGALSFEGPSFSTSTSITELGKI